MKYTSRFLLNTFLALAVILVVVGAPIVAFADDTEGGGTAVPSETELYKLAIVPCGTDDVDGDNIVDNPCGLKDVVELGKRILIVWITIGVVIATLGFSYAGYLYITAMGSQEKVSHAHSIFIKTFWGFVFMLSAWLIVKTLEGIFLTDEIQQRSLLHVPSETAPDLNVDQDLVP